MRVRVKLCGITRPDDALTAIEAGVDALGFVFSARSPRAVDPRAAAAIIDQLPPFVSMVGLFLDPDADQVRHVLQHVRLDILQFHGNESSLFCRQFGLRYIKALPMGGAGVDVQQLAGEHPQALAFLLDAHAPGQRGGLGEVFDWRRIPTDLDRPLVLAGGLHPENVATAVAGHRPYAVDVSSGVESAPGIKDPDRINAFMRGVEHGSHS